MTDAYDPQDSAEQFDEDRLNEDDSGAPTAEMKTFEELPDVLDLTQRIGDGDDRFALDEEGFSEDLIDDEDLEEDPDAELSAEEDPYGLEEVEAALDEVSLDYLADIEEQRGAQSSAAHFESRGELSTDDLKELGYVDPETEEPK